MTLREKFEQWLINDEDEHYKGMVEQVAIEHEKIADIYAIGFARWIEDNCWKIESDRYLYQDDQFKTKELLEIFKKEKGL